jgi:hypothetical protein
MKNMVKLALLVAFGAVFVGCNQLGESNNSPTVLEESQAIADLGMDDAEEMADTLGVSDSSAFGFSSSVVTQSLGLQALPAGCRTVSAGAVGVDSDADNIPDDVTFLFDATNCLRNLPGGGTITRSGTKQIQDTSPLNARNHKETLTNMQTVWSRTLGGNAVVWTATRNGNRDIAQGTDTALTRAHDVSGTSVRTVNGTANANIAWTNNVAFAYTANAGSTISNTARLPDGTLVVSGIWKAKRGVRPERQFSVSSNGLVYNSPSTCAARRLTAGSISFDDLKTNITVTFNGCNTAPSVAVTPKP